MKYYSKKIIQDYIEANKDKLEFVDVGMREDWGWTSGEIWNAEDGYDSRFESDDRIEVAGIHGSCWATPVMKVYFKDGDSDIIECYTDDRVSTDRTTVATMKAFASATGGMDFVY